MLTGVGELGTIKAMTSVVVYEITQACLAPLVQDRPAIADELASILSRRNALELLRLGKAAGAPTAKAELPLRARIRHLFDL
jgi:CRP-like cAMP-binding protein